MNIFKVLILVVMSFSSIFANEQLDEEIKDSIVKIYTVSQVYNYNQPWNVRTVRTSGSGCIIKGNRILTNAHIVANHTFIEVKKYGTTKRVQAHVLYVSHQADLALLSVDSEEFFKGVKPLELDALPRIQQKVTVYGFPAGGTTLSVTTGVVSRIEHRRYAHGGERYLAIQVDAAINSGNSGGPAISDGEIVGVVMQGMLKSQNIGYLVPTSMIKHFLKDIEDKHYDGFADLGISTQKIESTTLREMYGMDENSTGQLIINIVYNSSANEVLKVGDIITHIDGYQIYNDGTVSYRHHQYTFYKYFVDLHQIGEDVELDIIREQKRLKVKVKLKNIADDFLLVKTTRFDKAPRYFIYGGYVFVPLTKNLLRSSGGLIELRCLASKWPKKDQKEIVVLLKVLASKLSTGNYNITLWPIQKVNGKTFATFDEFYQVITNYKGKYILLEDDEGMQVVMDVNASLKENKKILDRYGIKNDRSLDLLPTF